MAKYIIEDSTLQGLADAIRKVAGTDRTYTPTEMIEAVTTILENGAYILVDENGTEYPAFFVDNEVVFDATANDIRLGKVAGTESGVTTGEKFIPPYYTSVGWKLIPVGSECTITLENLDAYDYTALQCIICPYNTSVSESVSAEKVVIDNNVYTVNSTIAVSSITKDPDNKSVKLGIVNDSDTPYLIRYFTYKEEA